MGKAFDKNRIEDLLKTDFSPESRTREKTLEQLLLKLDNQQSIEEEKRNFSMKKSYAKPVLAAAVLAVLVMGFAMTAYGQELYKVIREVFVGEHARYIVTEPADIPVFPDKAPAPDLKVPDEQKGKIYDKDGNVLEQFPETGDVYNKDGEVLGLYSWPAGDGKVITKALTEEEFLKEHNELQNSGMTAVTKPEDAKPYLAFDFSLPGYMPAGYAFDKIQLYNDENGKPVRNCEYAEVSFSNGDHARDIHLQLRLMNEKTAYEADGDVEEIEINGNKGVAGEGTVDVEIGEIMYMFSAGTSGIDNEQLIKMAESIQ